VAPSRIGALPILRELFGDQRDLRAPAVLTTPARLDEGTVSPFHFVTLRPFADKVRGRIGSYRIGFFPGERSRSNHGVPEGFIEVTAANQDLAISDNFRLRDFLTHDQGNVWPKYLVLREALVDKLELIVDELRASGIPAERMRVMSGFRTPQYNALGVGAGGRVRDSRHQFGDAADVYITSGGREGMADLNRDGRITTADARVLADAAERVERRYPELAGGIGIYKATRAHGPFVHIDVRGVAARWGTM
jgi:hypothetical protein